MKKVICILAISLMFSNFIFSQTYKIVKIFDTNLFKLDNNETVKLYGLYIPSSNDTNEALANLATKILEWEKGVLLDKTFRVEYKKREIKGINEVQLYKSHALSEENINATFLSNGYAALVGDIDETNYQSLNTYQTRAQKQTIGIWKLGVLSPQMTSPNILKSIDQNVKIYEQPFLPLLSVSAVLLVLTWDSFDSASDIQKTIDDFKVLDSDYDSSDLESSKVRKQVLGITCLVASVVTTIFAFKSVEVKTDLNSISVSYRF